MANPSNLYRHLPDVFDRHPDSDQYKLLAGYAKGTEDARTEVEDFQHDRALATADGVGLTRYGENFSIPRPPGMLDNLYRNVIAIIAGGRRGTVAIIKAVLEAATGAAWIVTDRQLDIDEGTGYGVPAFEVWAKAASTTGHSYGLMYAGFDTHISGSPEESGVAGPILNETGKPGGRHNDHASAPLDLWTMALVDKVRPAGVRVIYKEF